MSFIKGIIPSASEEIMCPNCGEKENLHFNYDYSKKDLPIIDVLCNECGTFFEN